MPSCGGFIEGEEEDGEGDEAMECSSVPGGGGGGGGGGPEQLLTAFGPGVKGTVGGSEEVGRSDVGVASRHDGTDSPSNHRSQSTTGLDKRSELHADPASNQTESSGSEHPEQERAQSHSEIMRAMREMKRRLPSDRKCHRKARTVEALRYALRCVKQVQASSEYHKVLLGSWKEEQGEVSPTVCTLEELESVTSEHTLKNTGMFAVVFSLASGRVLYVSEQAPSILGLRGGFLREARFVELLYPQDVNMFYARTAQPHLPPWTLGPDRKADLYDCTWVKSFFCRLRGGKDGEGEVRYSPFRLTPYLLKVRGGEGEEDQPCCLALAERVHSGYEAPRIPLEKRIFTTTHSPGCVFMEVDDRAVPLLGYLPQDLIGSSVLACLHPEDRPLMLALHHKILKYAGQRPFEDRSFRLRCQNGDYVTLDTSWSSFVNPWSRKVAFVIGRHRVRTGPLNEEVFATRGSVEQPRVSEEIQELQTQIYRLFLQPVYNNGSSGYGSMGSNGSHEPYVSMSSSESNGNLWEDSLREPMKLQRICSDVRRVKAGGQQGLLDSRCKLPPMGRAAAGPTAPPTASQPTESGVALSPPHKDSRKPHHIPSYQQINCVDSIIRYLESYTAPSLKRKTESLASSSSSEEDKGHGPAMAAEEAMQEETGVSGGSAVTLAHTAGAVVGAPLTGVTLSPQALSVVSLTSQCSYSSTIVHVPQPESEVTALEDAPMGSEHADPTPPQPRPQPSPLGLTKEVLSAHTQKEEQEYVGRFRHRILQGPYRSYLQRDSSPGPSQQRGPSGNHGEQEVGGAARRKTRVRELKAKRRREQWSSDSYASPPEGHCVAPSPCQNGAPSQSSAVGLVSPYQQVLGVPSAPLYPGPLPYQGFSCPPSAPGVLPTPGGVGPYVAPVMAMVLPNFPSYVQGACPLGPTPPFFLPPFNPSPFGSSPFPAFPGPALVPRAPPTPVPPTPSPSPGALDPPSQLFSSSRSSSPLQLNLLQEELPKPAQPQGPAGDAESQEEAQRKEEEGLSDSGNHDNRSTSSEVLDLLLQEDTHSRTGSNVSGSGSNGTSTSNTGSGDSSLYFASSDSSHTSPPASRGQPQGEQAAEDRANFKRCVENSLWSLIQHTPEPVMMTYQISPRDQAQVLKEDLERLLLLAPLQPVFTEAQKEELAEVHPWMKEHGLPEEINTQGCVTCMPDANSPAPPISATPHTQDHPPQDPSPDT
ncbi:period circadian protein homolog 3-like [Anguilla anguilla]|uniref:period circadian protein homolog 3-like n=1 Tax=Anguilla anguilla TaxID=7936 RepID=UPI0015B23975|nr:period circadian protein homolog 3-like [Anguilla anguilla]